MLVPGEGLRIRLFAVSRAVSVVRSVCGLFRFEVFAVSGHTHDHAHDTHTAGARGLRAGRSGSRTPSISRDAHQGTPYIIVHPIKGAEYGVRLPPPHPKRISSMGHALSRSDNPDADDVFLSTAGAAKKITALSCKAVAAILAVVRSREQGQGGHAPCRVKRGGAIGWVRW